MRSVAASPPLSLLVALGLFSALASAPARARQWPNETCPDSLTIYDIENEGSPCHPAVGDTLFTGIRGIVTAVDTKRSGVGFWIQLSPGGPWTGLRVFTANVNWPVTLGDSVVVCPTMVAEYQNETELYALDGSWGSNLDCKVIASGQPLPPFQEGTSATWNSSSSNSAMEPWEGCRVSCLPTGDQPLRVARVFSGGFVVVDDACAADVCDSVFVNTSVIPDPSLNPPSPGTMLAWVRGIVGQTASGYWIRVSGEVDLLVPAAPTSWGRVKALYR